jgi:hypothetical protein
MDHWAHFERVMALAGADDCMSAQACANSSEAAIAACLEDRGTVSGPSDTYSSTVVTVRTCN